MMAAGPGPGDRAGQLGRRAAEGHGEKRIEGNRNGNWEPLEGPLEAWEPTPHPRHAP